MKKIITIILLFFLSAQCYSQATIAESRALQFADRLKDSLKLTDQQAAVIYRINMRLHIEKQSARKEISATDSLQVRIQKVESMRDSLYKKILNEEQYLLYKKMKRNLIASK